MSTNWHHHLHHATHFLQHTEAGKKTVQTVLTAAATAAPLVVAGAIIAAPFAAVGLGAYAAVQWWKRAK